MKTITINVTAKDIQLGQPGSPLRCPIARAIGRKLTRYASQYVNNQRVSLFDGTTICLLPGAARNFIVAFDNKRGVSPFKFNIEVSDGNIN